MRSSCSLQIEICQLRNMFLIIDDIPKRSEVAKIAIAKIAEKTIIAIWDFLDTL